MAIESPKYKVVKKENNIEIRNYDGYIIATVISRANSYSSATNSAFRILADYIFGNNKPNSKIAMTTAVTSQKIAMTAPVNTSKLENQSYLVSFTMPSSYDINTLPTPLSSDIKISKIESHKVLTISFSGLSTETKIKKKIEELTSWAKTNKIKILGQPTLSRYDPPWKPGFIRKNEISFKID